MQNLRVLILAAGKSTRMKSKYAKVLQRAGGRRLIEHVLTTARNLSPDIFGSGQSRDFRSYIHRPERTARNRSRRSGSA
ncbi:MAG: hypothetical protein DMG14_01310 [Acidobacteria bacterium]|nr:MAG: hypothetical protein DMG14_01310 [Acidobacteriota bacterium]